MKKYVVGEKFNEVQIHRSIQRLRAIFDEIYPNWRSQHDNAVILKLWEKIFAKFDIWALKKAVELIKEKPIFVQQIIGGYPYIPYNFEYLCLVVTNSTDIELPFEHKNVLAGLFNWYRMQAHALLTKSHIKSWCEENKVEPSGSLLLFARD